VYFLYEEDEEDKEDEEDEERVAAGGSQSGSGGSSDGSSRGGAGPTRLAHLLQQQHQQQEGEEDGVEAGVSRLPTPLIAAESYVDMSRGVSWVLEREAVLAARCNALMGLAGKVSALVVLPTPLTVPFACHPSSMLSQRVQRRYNLLDFLEQNRGGTGRLSTTSCSLVPLPVPLLQCHWSIRLSCCYVCCGAAPS
jgi:hypothetical protein